MSNRKKNINKLAGASSQQGLVTGVVTGVVWLMLASPAWPASITSRLPPTNNPPVAAAARTVIWWTERGEHSEAPRLGEREREHSSYPSRDLN